MAKATALLTTCDSVIDDARAAVERLEKAEQPLQKDSDEYHMVLDAINILYFVRGHSKQHVGRELALGTSKVTALVNTINSERGTLARAIGRDDIRLMAVEQLSETRQLSLEVYREAMKERVLKEDRLLRSGKGKLTLEKTHAPVLSDANAALRNMIEATRTMMEIAGVGADNGGGMSEDEVSELAAVIDKPGGDEESGGSEQQQQESAGGESPSPYANI